MHMHSHHENPFTSAYASLVGHVECLVVLFHNQGSQQGPSPTTMWNGPRFTLMPAACVNAVSRTRQADARLLVGDQRRLRPVARLEGVAPAEGHLHAALLLPHRQRRLQRIQERVVPARRVVSITPFPQTFTLPLPLTLSQFLSLGPARRPVSSYAWP